MKEALIRKSGILDWNPDVLSTLLDLAVSHPNRPLEEIAVERGIAKGLARNIATEPRFALLVARRAADRLAREAMPQAVLTLRDIASGHRDAPPAVQVQAARTILQHVDRYLEGHMDGARREQDIADMSLEDLRELVARGEARLAGAAVDITPDNAPNGADAPADDVLSCLE